MEKYSVNKIDKNKNKLLADIIQVNQEKLPE